MFQHVSLNTTCPPTRCANVSEPPWLSGFRQPLSRRLNHTCGCSTCNSALARQGRLLGIALSRVRRWATCMLEFRLRPRDATRFLVRHVLLLLPGDALQWRLPPCLPWFTMEIQHLVVMVIYTLSLLVHRLMLVDVIFGMNYAAAFRMPMRCERYWPLQLGALWPWLELWSMLCFASVVVAGICLVALVSLPTCLLMLGAWLSMAGAPGGTCSKQNPKCWAT